MAGNVRDFIEVKLKGETAGQLSKRNLAYDTGFTLAPGTYTFKFLARENETGKIGTYETKFVIPDLTTDQLYLPISSVVLSNQRENLSAAVATVERDKRLLASNPLVVDNQKLIPSVTRVFRQDQEMYVYLETYEPAAETTQPHPGPREFLSRKGQGFRDRTARDQGRAERQVQSRAGAFQRATGQTPAGTVHVPGQHTGPQRPEICLLARAHRALG